jgi:hypothetical protein
VPAAWSRAAVAVGLVLLAGCGLTNAGCTSVGADTGVLFEFDDVLTAHPGETLLVDACVKDTCDSLRVTRRDRQHGLGVAPDLVKDSSPLPRP